MENNYSDLTPYMEAILERFKPVETAIHATHQLTTKEVADAIRELNPGCKLDLAQVYDVMKQAGFTFSSLPGTTGLYFKWLLAER